MNRTTKLILDIILGAVIPIAILSYLSEPMGAIPAYILAALIPVGWVFADLFFITRRFNFITSYIGAAAIIRGLLTFWFVDGLLFAIKDTAGFFVAIAVFGGSVIIRRPIMTQFFIQALNPDTPQRERSLETLLDTSSVHRALMIGSMIIVGVNILAALANFFLNLFIVTATFGTDLFNQQVAQVNAITRIALTIPDMLGFGVALWLVYHELYKHLPKEDGKSQLESDFWDLVQLRESQQQS